MRTKINARSSAAAGGDAEQNPLPLPAATGFNGPEVRSLASRGRALDRLVDQGSGAQAAKTGGDINLQRAGHFVGADAVRRGLAGFVGDHRHGFSAIQKFAARSGEGQGERNRSAGYGPVIVVFDADYGIVREALSNPADYALSFDHDDLDARGKILGVDGR